MHESYFESNRQAEISVLAQTVESNCEIVENEQLLINDLRNRSNIEVLWYTKLIDARGLIALRSNNNLYIPATSEPDRIRYRAFLFGKWGCFLGGLIVMSVMIAGTLDLSLVNQILAICLSVALIAIIIPAFLIIRARIEPQTPDPIYKLRWELGVSGFLIIFGFLVWALTRGSSGLDDFASVAYMTAGPIAEAGLALGSACFWVLSNYYRATLVSAQNHKKNHK